MQTNLIKGVVALVTVALLSGCASQSKLTRDAVCVGVGAVAGGAAGAADDTDAAVVGTIGGALVGALVCHLMDGDTDNDGVKDSIDQCAATPMGKAVDENGCSLDLDEDGVVNSVDECPYTPVGQKVNAQGCPEAEKVAEVKSVDDDKDGVLNTVDQCPETPLGAKVDNVGCPKVVQVSLKGVNFKFGSAELSDAAKEVLAEQAETLKQNPLLKVSVIGHTDNNGEAVFNKTLSFDRANAVKNYFVSKGVDEAILTVKGEGEAMPVADNETVEGRAENRRVELNIISE